MTKTKADNLREAELRREVDPHVTIEVTSPVVLVVPTVPNCIQAVTNTEGQREYTSPVDIASLTNEQLRLVGEAWTDKLIARAAVRREKP